MRGVSGIWKRGSGNRFESETNRVLKVEPHDRLVMSRVEEVQRAPAISERIWPSRKKIKKDACAERGVMARQKPIAIVD